MNVKNCRSHVTSLETPKFVLNISGVVRPKARTPLSELQRSNTPIEKIYK